MFELFPDVGFIVHLEEGVVSFTNGFTTPVAFMIDDLGEETEDPDEAVVVAVLFPSDSDKKMVDVIDLAILNDLSEETLH